MSGSLLPTATSAAPNRSYYAAFDSIPGSSISTINTVNVNASTITAAGDSSTDIGVGILNQAFLTFSSGAAVDSYTMGIQNISSTVIPYGTATLDRNVLQVSGYGNGDAPAGVLTGSLYLNSLGTNIPVNTQCATLKGDASGNIVMLGNDFRISTTTGFYNGINVFSGNVIINDDFTVNGDTTLAATVVDGNVTVGSGYTMAAGTTITNSLSTGTALVAGKPVASPSLVAFAGLSGTQITLAVGTQTISSQFSVVANHVYRITVQAEIVSGDTNPGSYVQLVALVPSNTIGLGLQIGGPVNQQGARSYVGMFRATASASTCVIQSLNVTVASAQLNTNPSDAAFNPGILIEDLGVL